MAGALERVSNDDPRACQKGTQAGPCPYKALEGSLYCPIHGGTPAALATEKADLKKYKLNSAYAGRAKDFAGSTDLKSLTDELALLRTSLEVIFNSIKNEGEMLLYSDKIEKLSKGIQSMVVDIQKLQERNRELLGKDTVFAIFDRIMQLLVEHVKDADVLLILAEKGCEIITNGVGGTV